MRPGRSSCVRVVFTVPSTRAVTLACDATAIRTVTAKVRPTRRALTADVARSAGPPGATSLGSPQPPAGKNANPPTARVSTWSAPLLRYAPEAASAGRAADVKVGTGVQARPSVEKPSEP